MKLNFEVKNIKLLKNGVSGLSFEYNGITIPSNPKKSIELETSVNGNGVKNSNATIDLASISEELHDELLAVINKIEKKLNKKGK